MFENLVRVFVILASISLIFTSFQYKKTWEHVRDQHGSDCFAFCNDKLKGLENLHFDVETGVITCTCTHDLPFYANNFSYVREPNLTDIFSFN